MSQGKLGSMLNVGPEYVLRLQSVRVLDRCPTGAIGAGAAGAASRAIEVVYQAPSDGGLGPAKTLVVALADDSFEGIFAACQRLANEVLSNEFRLNAEVELSFTPVGEHYIALWHTREQNYLRCPLEMNVHWSCEYLRRTNPRMITLGVSECEDDTKLAFDRLPAEKTAEVLIHSMFSGIEFVGTLMNTRLRAQRDHAKLVEEGRAG